MSRMGISLVLLVLLCGSAGWASARVRCTTRWDDGLKRAVIECTDGSRAISRWDEGFKRWRTDVVRPGMAKGKEQR